MDFEELAGHFSLSERRHRKALSERLRRMLRAGQLLLNRGDEYCLTERLHLVPGAVSGHPDGFGFLLPDDGDEDVYLSPREMRALMHGDRIAVKVVRRDRRGRPEGELVEILERGQREVAGQYIRERGIGLVIPDNPRVGHRVLIPVGNAGGATAGDMVVAEILDYPTAVEQPTGRIRRIIGRPGAKGMATELAIHAHGIPDRWPEAVKAEAEEFGKTVPAKAKRGRVDLRELPLVTIDGADARDFDDAVYCEPDGDGDGWRLVVAIADVAHYVAPGSAIDKEATRRGTSVYFPDRVVPMLPQVLSNGLCSLNPKVDRLAMVCEMRIASSGKVAKAEFHQAVMRSAARLTYSQVARVLDGAKPAAARVPKTVVPHLQNLHALYRALARARSRRGALELEIPQLRIRLDERGEIEAVESVPRNDAHKLIEECMIAANVAAARFLREKRLPTLYRVHAKPDPERFEDFRLYAQSLGLKVPDPQQMKPQAFAKLMREVAERPDAYTISMALLRAMAHAEYTPDNIGHFGLALPAYAHFTSPIRRYPDLLVHRAIKHAIAGGKPGKFRYSHDDMERLGQLTSAHERRAEDATREVEAWLKCQFMEDKVGERHEGIVTGVTHFGLFVQLTEFQVDGLVHVSSLRNDYYEYDAAGQRLVGSRSGREYALGDALAVVVQKVDMESRRIDFRLAEGPAGRPAAD